MEKILNNIFDSLEGKYQIEKEDFLNQIPFKHLFLSLPSDVDPSRKYACIIHLMKSKEMTQFLPVETPLPTLQILHILPHKIGPTYVPQVMRLLNLINTAAPLPGFGYDEREHQCYYKFCFPVLAALDQNEFIENSLLIMRAIFDVYLEIIQKVSLGQESVEHLLGINL